MCYLNASMKALSSMAALSVSLFLVSCSLTQQQAQENAADSPGDKKAAEITGNPFSTRARKAAPQKEVKEEPEAEASLPVPTPEQQAAAESLMAETAKAAPTLPQEAEFLQPEEFSPAPANIPPAPSGGLRMGRMAPQEDPASASDAPAPDANSVERHGLRSPKLPSGLPMNINGKLTGQH